MDNNPGERQPSIEELAAAAAAKQEVVTPGPTETPVAPMAPVVEAPVEATPAQVAPVATMPVEPAPTETVTTQSAPAKTKRGKGGLIAATIILILLAAAAIAAILILKPFEPQPKVEAAISNLVENGVPKMVSLTGTVKVAPMVESPVSEIMVDFDSGINNRNGENFTKATVKATFVDERDFSFSAEEIHTSDGNLYLRLSRIADELIDFNELELDAPILESIGVFEAIDNEWIMIPDSDFSNVSDIYGTGTPAACLVDAIDELGEFTNDFVTEYTANPFLTYSESTAAITPKDSTLYRLGIDNSKLTSFVNAMDNRGFMNSLLACSEKVAISDDTNVSEIEEIVELLPEVYVEVGDNNQFTRMYLEFSYDEAEIVADVAIGYPTSVTIDEPELYITLSNVLEKLLTQFYGGIPMEADTITE